MAQGLPQDLYRFVFGCAQDYRRNQTSLPTEHVRVIASSSPVPVLVGSGSWVQFLLVPVALILVVVSLIVA